MSDVARMILLVAGLAVASRSGSLVAQSDTPIALLQTAPRFFRGIDLLAPNVIPHWTALYQITALPAESSEGGEEPGQFVRVRYVPGSLAGAQSWARSPCRSRALRTQDGVFFYQSGTDWALLFSSEDPALSGELDPGIACVFIDAFVSRFQFFLELETDLSTVGDGLRPPPFPAVLDSPT